jgi:hypothetical protein
LTRGGLSLIDKSQFSQNLHIELTAASRACFYYLFTLADNHEDKVMTLYEKQILDTERHYDQMMSEIEALDPNILYSVVPGSKLHEKIHNPITEGIDEG